MIRAPASVASQRGVSLVELIATITVISMAGTAVVGPMSYLAHTGGRTFQQSQAQSIASGYLDEISGLSFVDPDGLAEGPNRALWDNVADYDNLDTPTASDKAGNPIGNFRVRVDVSQGGLGTLPANAVWRIDVTVDFDGGSVLATGYRTNHP
jgi:prepilin-type N-terminal cleavage/methylation domain-containing protein